MNGEHSPRGRVARLLAAMGLVAMVAAAHPETGAQGRAPSFARASRYPRAIAPRSETMASVQARERMHGARRPDPQELQKSFNLPVEASHAGARLNPAAGGRQIDPGLPASMREPSPGEATPAPAVEAAEAQFDTIAYTGWAPPDSAIAAGPAHLVSSVNSSVQVRTLAGGHLFTTTLSSFFPDDPTGFVFDPRLAYDESAGRFILVALGRRNTFPQLSTCLIAVSASSDPTGTWHKYVFHVGRPTGTTPTEWADYPSIGYDGVAFTLSFNMFGFPTETDPSRPFKGTRTLLLDKARMLAGAPVTPYILDDLLLPPPFVPDSKAATPKPAEGAGNLVLCESYGYGLTLYRITNPLGIGGPPGVTATFIDTADVANPGDVPQSDPNLPLLDTGNYRLQKTVYRDGYLWTCQTFSASGAAGGPAGVRFYRVAAASGTLQPSDILTIVDPALAFFFPSIVPDARGNAVAVFQGASATQKLSLYHARYDAATRLFQPPVLLQAGSSTYGAVGEASPKRTGDYTDASLDVTTGTRVWVQGELILTSTAWQMRAGKVPTLAQSVQNGSFEEPATGPGVPFWTLNTGTGAGTAALQPGVAYEGKHSVRLEAGAPDDTGVHQLMAVKPNTSYRLSGWVQTRNVAGADANATVGACLAVRDGFERTRSVSGTAGWTYLAMEFNSGARAQVEVGPRLGFHGSLATGKAWFDGIRLVELGPLNTDAALMSLTLTPLSVPGGKSVTGKLTFTGPARAGYPAVTLTSSDPAVARPAQSSLNVPAGSVEATFAVTTSPVAWTKNVTITAEVLGVSKSAVLRVNPPSK